MKVVFSVHFGLWVGLGNVGGKVDTILSAVVSVQ